MTRALSPIVATFLVRTSRDPRGRLRGVVERVRTGEKERFTEVAELGRLIEQMLERDGTQTRTTRRTP